MHKILSIIILILIIALIFILWPYKKEGYIETVRPMESNRYESEESGYIPQ